MSIYLKCGTFRSGNSYNLKTCPRKSAHEEQLSEASEAHTTEKDDKANTEFSPGSIEERIKAKLEPLHAQISLLTQMINKLIQDNLARKNPTAGPRK